MKSSLVSALQHGFLTHTSKPAVIGLHGEWTYDELNRRSQHLAHVLRAAGVKRNGNVALLLRRSPALILAQVATLRVGAAYSPLDTQSPPAQLAAALNVLRPAVMLTDGSFDVPHQQNCTIIDLRTIDFETPVESDDSWAECADDSIAYVMFTSGTTGVPKGVMIPHSGISRLVLGADWATFDSNSRFGFISSPAFDASTLEVWAPLLNGSCCVVQEKAQPSLDDIANFILLHHVTDVFLTSALFSAMVEHRLDSFAGLRQLMTGGERVSPHHARIVLKTYPLVRLINGYGPTENTTFTACRSITLEDTENQSGIPIGFPIRGTTVRIGADESQKEFGELLAGGSGVAAGYLNDAELTARKFVTIDGVRWYKTGDLVKRRADGALEYEGRIDRQVKVQGHRIELDAIEALLNSLPGIGQCAVFVAGEFATNRHLVAIYTLVDGVRPTPSEILDLLRKNLPMHSIPRVLRPVATMPRTANGKIDARELQAMYFANAGGAAPPSNDARTDTETRLCQLWSELFPSVRIHPMLNLDELGATSLQALQLSASIRREFQKTFSAIQVIRTPVLRDQAALIEELPVASMEPARSIDSGEPHELTQIQHSVLAADALDESGCAFLVHVALRFDASVEMHRVSRAFEKLAARHPALRLAIANDPGTYIASIDKSLRTGWLQHHGTLPSSFGDDILPPDVVRAINRPLQRTSDGVMRVDCWGPDNQASLVVWTIHHVAIDEASIDHCLSDLDAIMSERELAPMIANPLDLAAFERKHTAMTAQQYWPSRIVEVLGNKPPALPRAPGFGCEVPVHLPQNIARDFLELCRSASVTPFVPLLVAYGRAMQNVFGNEYAFVATPFSRRSDPLVADAVGCLIDLNMVEAGARPGETIAENLGRVYSAASKLQECLFFPFEQVSEQIARLKPGAERHLNSFAFTWRLAPNRTLTLGETSAHLLRIPQQGARFGMTLHGWLENGALRCSVETLNDAVSRECACKLGKQLAVELPLVCSAGVATTWQDAVQPASESGARYSAKLLDGLRQRWISTTGIPESAFTEQGNFWELGGNSLLALQLFAGLRKEFGVHIEAADFFALPTFANLHVLASSRGARANTIHDVIGASDARRLVVLFPGDNGSALGMHPMAEYLQRMLGKDSAVVIVDLEEILRRAPEGDLTSLVNNRCIQLLKDLGMHRVAALGGFSSGGLTALAVSRAFPPESQPSVWLLDTYKPEDDISLLMNRTVRPAVRALLRSRIVAKMAGTHQRVAAAPKVSQQFPVGSIEHVRDQAREALLSEQPELPTGSVHLVQAKKTARREFLLWNRETNGFPRQLFKSGSILSIDCLHEEIPAAYAELAAGFIAASLKPVELPRSKPAKVSAN